MALRLTARVVSNSFGKIAKQLQSAADAITDEVGRDQQLAAYVASLGVQR